MSEFTMTVGGDAITTSRSFGVVNPASGDVHAEAPECSRSELDAAMDAAAKAYLSGSVWTSDFERGVTIAGQLECGTAWVNAHPLVQDRAGIHCCGAIAAAVTASRGTADHPWLAPWARDLRDIAQSIPTYH